MPPLGVAYLAVVLLGYDRWLQKTWKKRHRERLRHLILMLALLLQGVVLLRAAVLIWR
jgi:hypothetical protein